MVVAAVLVGGGLALIAVGFLSRTYRREQELAELLDLPYGEHDVDVVEVAQRTSVIESTIRLAGRMVESFDTRGSLRQRLERARLPMRPGEYVLLAGTASVVAALVVSGITANLWFGAATLVAGAFAAHAYLDRRVEQRRRRFEEQFPDALSMIASSLSAGHTFLRAVQLMQEETEPPISEEFARVVSETQLGDPLVDALERMSHRLGIRDVAWVVQAIRIQQEVGGRLADLLHTLAEFIRAREEIRREVRVLTAEGRLSAWVLGALPVVVMLAVQVFNPGYLDPFFSTEPMFGVPGVALLAGTFASVVIGLVVINRMVRIDV